jgi:two-component system sensor histidine kinase RpfC
VSRSLAVIAKASPFVSWSQNWRTRGDSEHEQALIRVVIAVSVFIYLVSTFGFTGTSGGVVFVSTLYLVSALTIVGFIVIFPGISPSRRVTAIAIDVAAVSYAMIVAGEICAPFYGGYLWLAIACGFRYGRRYLHLTTILSLAGYSLALVLSPFWQEHRVLGVGLLVWLAILPMYVSLLLKRAEQALWDAQEADRTKSRFLASMSHELRTPLNAIIGYSELLQEELEGHSNPRHHEDLRRIQSAGQHLLALINDVLDFSRIEAGKMPLNFEVIELGPELHAVMDMVRPLAERNRNKLVNEYPGHAGRLRTDVVRFRQVLFNLLSNACKFTEQGTVRLRLPAERQTDDHVVLEVVDDGIGISAEQQRRLFQPFAQGDGSTSRRFGGTGLGLALTRRTCEMLGGTIELESQAGHGTTFRVTLPRWSSQTAD